jgi:hypothetical protein
MTKSYLLNYKAWLDVCYESLLLMVCPPVTDKCGILHFLFLEIKHALYTTRDLQQWRGEQFYLKEPNIFKPYTHPYKTDCILKSIASLTTNSMRETYKFVL